MQFSATSHTPAAARHMVEEARKESAGHAFEEPSQVSALSQTPAMARHAVPADCFESAGHVVLAPVQTSAASQTSAAARHAVPAFPAACWQLLLEPSQRSVLQTLLSTVQAVPIDCLLSAGQVLAPPHVSAASHSPAEARQTVLLASVWQVDEQQSPLLVFPSSHSSPLSTVLFPQTTPLDWQVPSVHVVVGQQLPVLFIPQG